MNKTGIDRVLCMNNESRMHATLEKGDNRNSRASAILSSCSTQKGLEKAACIRRIGKSLVKAANVKVEKLGKAIEKSGSLSQCVGLRAKALSRCIQNLRKPAVHSMNKSSASSASSMSSSN